MNVVRTGQKSRRLKAIFTCDFSGMSYLRRPNTGRPQLIHNNPYDHHQTTMEYKPYLLKEDNEQKIPLFLIKLWNIVEDPTYREVVRWDEV
jgi:hypothetical protein